MGQVFVEGQLVGRRPSLDCAAPSEGGAAGSGRGGRSVLDGCPGLFQVREGGREEGRREGGREGREGGKGEGEREGRREYGVIENSHAQSRAPPKKKTMKQKTMKQKTMKQKTMKQKGQEGKYIHTTTKHYSNQHS